MDKRRKKKKCVSLGEQGLGDSEKRQWGGQAELKKKWKSLKARCIVQTVERTLWKNQHKSSTPKKNGA